MVDVCTDIELQCRNFGHGHQSFTLSPTTAQVLADVMDSIPSATADALSPARRPR